MQSSILVMILALALPMQGSLVPNPHVLYSSIGKFAEIDESSDDQAELQLLDSAWDLAKEAPAAIKSKVCYEIGIGYAQINQTKGTNQLKECFHYTREINGVHKIFGAMLQAQILDTLLSMDIQNAKELLRAADPNVKARIQSHLFDIRVSHGDYAGALAQAEGLSHSPEFPYQAVVTLMGYLSGKNESGRRRIFLVALRNFQSENSAKSLGLEDLTTMVVRFWRELPPEMILKAIDEILDHAKIADSAPTHVTLALSTSLGEAYFNGIYQYRLFELIPVLEHLNPTKAVEILKNNPKLAQILKTYPNGLQSLEPAYSQAALEKGATPQVMVTQRLQNQLDKSDTSDKEQTIAHETAGIAAEALDDPEQALNRANGLPDAGVDPAGRSIKADLLARIAATTVGTAPQIAVKALRQLLKTIEGYPTLSQAYYYVVGAGVYFRMGEQAEADRLIQKSMSIALNLYKVDNDSENPNKAFKLDWPSAATWRACVLLEASFDLQSAIMLLHQINDSEIRAEIQALLANKRLGLPVPINTARARFSDGRESAQTFIIPH